MGSLGRTKERTTFRFLKWPTIDSFPVTDACQLGVDFLERVTLRMAGVFSMDTQELLKIITNAANDGVTELDLSFRGIQELPSEIGKLQNLTSLDLSGNPLRKVPAAITQLQNLTSLDISKNQLSEVPAAITQLQNLTSLDISANQLSAVPAAIFQLQNLTSLNLSGNPLRKVPAAIFQLQNLTSLDISRNKLSEVPAAITQLQNLTSLNLSGNQLSEVPAAIIQLQNLTSLNLRDNLLSEVPAAITQLQNLTSLDIRDNLLSEVPPEILNKWYDAQAILLYINRIESEAPKRPLNEAKMLVVGEGEVGKTSLVKMLVEGKCDQHQNKTDGIDIHRWEFTVADGSTVQLNIWDFGGQEIMHATHQFFLTKRSLYLLLLDARQDERRGRLEYWLKIIRSFGADSPVIVVLNKSDQHRLDLNRNALRSKYPQIRGFIETACFGEIKGQVLNANGIETLKDAIAQELSTLKHIRSPLLLTWFEVKNELEEMKQNYISEERYLEMCRDHSIEDKTDQDLLLGYLNDLGVILTYKEDPRLRDTNILNPEWVTEGIYRIINSNELFQTKGMLDIKKLKLVLPPKKYPSSRHDFILGMMENFELCFPLEGERGRYLIPELLPKDELAFHWDDTEALCLEYHYDVLPSSVISRFIVRTRLHHPPKKLSYWRSGIILRLEENPALVKADFEAARVTISVQGDRSSRRRALTIIRDHFGHIHSTIQGINAEEMVPVPGENCPPVPYGYLLELESDPEQEDTFRWKGARNRLSILGLLNGIDEDQVNRLRWQIKKTAKPTPSAAKEPATPPRGQKPSLWRSGSFLLISVLAIIGSLVIGSQYVSWYALPFILIATVLLILVVFAALLQYEGKLDRSKTFLTLMLEVLRKLVLLRKDGSSKGDIQEG